MLQYKRNREYCKNVHSAVILKNSSIIGKHNSLNRFAVRLILFPPPLSQALHVCGIVNTAGCSFSPIIHVYSSFIQLFGHVILISRYGKGV